MRNISTGFGLCVLGLGIAAWPVLDRLAPSASTSAVAAAAAALSTAATAQTGPTIVRYGIVPNTTGPGSNSYVTIVRAWSDGRMESSGYYRGSNCRLANEGSCSWAVFSDPAQGLTYRSDINFDEKVDGADLATLLTDWGNAPRQGIPPSDCPLALINP